MLTISDEVDGSFYVDIVLSLDEIKNIKLGEMICGETVIRKRKYHIGVRLHGQWDEESSKSED